MNNDTRIIQKALTGTDTTQIGIQNNYGISAEEASKLAINLFVDNFPKLQEEARKIARERAEELCGEVVNNLNSRGKRQFNEFADPDVQFVFYEAQKGYARFGEKDTLILLSKLVSDRIEANNRAYLKRVYDKAIEITVSLSQSQLDYLSFMFITKCAKFQWIKTIADLKEHCEYVSAKLSLDENIVHVISYLNMLGCFQLSLGNATDMLAKRYNMEKERVIEILPKQYELIHSDYTLSPAAIVIAIINAQNKTEYKFDIDIWVHE